MTLTCGFIGLGQMGGTMTRNLAKAARVIVWARGCKAGRACCCRRGEACDRCQRFCGSLGRVFSACRTARMWWRMSVWRLWPRKRCCRRARSSSIPARLNMRRHSPSMAGLPRWTFRFIDAPVSGMQARAESGHADHDVRRFGGRDRAAAGRFSPPWLQFLPMGKPGSGQLAKLINQLLFDINAAALAEVLPLAGEARPRRIRSARSSIPARGAPMPRNSSFRTSSRAILEGLSAGGGLQGFVSGAEISARHTIPCRCWRRRRRFISPPCAQASGGQGQGRHDPPRGRGAGRRISLEEWGKTP